MKIKVIKNPRITKTLPLRFGFDLILGVLCPEGYKCTFTRLNNLFEAIEELRRNPSIGFHKAHLSSKDRDIFNATNSTTLKELRTTLALNPNYFDKDN